MTMDLALPGRNENAHRDKHESRADQEEQNIGRILTKEEEYFVSDLLGQLLPWLRDVAYCHGASRGLHAKNSDSLYVVINPRFSELSFHWVQHHNWLRVVVRPDEDSCDLDVASNGTQLYLIQPRYHASDFVVLVAGITEKTANAFFGKAHFGNKVTFCEAMIHKAYNGERMFNICTQVGTHWVCNECVDGFALAETISVATNRPKRPDEVEREKLSPALRYQILLRDGFSCKACGRSPLKGDKVKLHVDHIVPIIGGGKTVPKNLCTLCQDCNLGKRDSVPGEKVVEVFQPKLELGQGGEG